MKEKKSGIKGLFISFEQAFRYALTVFIHSSLGDYLVRVMAGQIRHLICSYLRNRMKQIC